MSTSRRTAHACSSVPLLVSRGPAAASSPLTWTLWARRWRLRALLLAAWTARPGEAPGAGRARPPRPPAYMPSSCSGASLCKAVCSSGWSRTHSRSLSPGLQREAACRAAEDLPVGCVRARRAGFQGRREHGVRSHRSSSSPACTASGCAWIEPSASRSRRGPTQAASSRPVPSP